MTTQSHDIAFLLKRVNDNLNKYLNNQLHRTGLTSFQLRMIQYIKENESEKKAQKDVEEYFGISHPTVVTSIHSLHQKGYLNVDTDTIDRRIKVLTLTEKGADLVHTIHEFRKKTDADLLQNLSKEEVQSLRSILTKISTNL